MSSVSVKSLIVNDFNTENHPKVSKYITSKTIFLTSEQTRNSTTQIAARSALVFDSDVQMLPTLSSDISLLFSKVAGATESKIAPRTASDRSTIHLNHQMMQSNLSYLKNDRCAIAEIPDSIYIPSINNTQEVPSMRCSSILFIDSNVANYQHLLAGIQPSTQVFVLEPQADGVQQITDVLARNRFSTVHIVSHGSPGCLYLGQAQLSLDTLKTYTKDVQNWFSGISKPQLFLYGCNVAAGDAGEELVQKLQAITGASIAASNSLTGNATQGGNWQLEYRLGKPLANLPFSSKALETYAYTLGVPTLVSIDRYNPVAATTSADILVFLVTFSEAVQNVDGTDFAFAPGSVSGATIQLVTPIAVGNNSQYYVQVGGVTTANGTVNLDLKATNNITSVSTNQALASLTPTGTDQTYTLDNIIATPTITSITTDSGAASTDFTTSDQTLVFSGTAEANSSVQVKLNGTNIGSPVVANGSGLWSLDYTGTTLTTGSYTLTATATDAAGNTSSTAPQTLVIDPIDPVFNTATVDGSVLVLTYTDSFSLDANNLPSTSAFGVLVNGSTRAVNNITVDSTAKTVTLLLASPVANGEAVTVSYTDPTAGNDANAIQDLAGNDAATFGATPATNSTPASNSAPTLTVPTFTGYTWFNRIGSAGETPTAVPVLSNVSVVNAIPIRTAYAPSITDSNDTHLEYATVTISNKQSGDLLSISGSLPAGITSAGYNSSTGQLMLTGHATIADYQIALSKVSFSNTLTNPNTANRTINFAVNDGQATSANYTSTVRILEPTLPIGKSPTGYLTGTSGTTTLYGVNLITGASSTLDSNLSTYNGTSVGTMNGASFNRIDGHIYSGSSTASSIARIGSYQNGAEGVGDYPVTILSVTGAPTTPKAGDIDDNGNLYFALATAALTVVNVNPNSPDYLKVATLTPTNLTATAAGLFYDVAYNAIDKSLYGFTSSSGTASNNRHLWKIDLSSVSINYSTGTATGAVAVDLGQVTGVPDSGTNIFGASYFDDNGNFYTSNNTTGNVYRIDPNNISNTKLFTVGPVTSQNDGARIVSIDLDYGDAPDSYKTLLASDGARHGNVNNQTYLGTTFTAEVDGPASGNGTQDADDGISSFSPLAAGQTTYSVTVNVTNQTGTSAILAGWIDFNRNNTFEAGEGTSVTVPNNTANGTATLTWTGITPSIGATYARFRISSDSTFATSTTSKFAGVLNDGEVEDYALTITAGDTTAPVADIVDISPDPRYTNAGIVNVTFSENVTGVDISDFTLTRDGVLVPLSGLTVTGSGSSYSIDLSSVTSVAGTYLLTLNSSGSGIKDPSNNALAGNAIDTFVVDTTAPVIDLDPSDVTQRNYTVNTSGTAISLDDNADPATVAEESDALSKLTVSVSGLVDGTNEKLTFGSTTIAANGSSGNQTNITVGSIPVDIVYTSGVFTITKNGGGTLTQAQAQNIVRDIQYRNDATTPTLGNRTFSFSATDIAGIDALPAVSTVNVTVAPTITVAFQDGDGRLNGAEDNAVTISGTTTAEVGQVVSLSISDGVHPAVTTSATVQAGGTYSATGVDLSGLDNGTLTVTANVSNLAGQAAIPAADTTLLDNIAPTISINVIASDDIINALEDDSPVLITGTTTGVEDGQIVSVVLHGVTYTASVTSNSWSLSVPAAAAQALNTSETVTANVSDLAGNPAAQATRNITHDAIAPVVTVNPLTTTDNTPQLTGTVDDTTAVVNVTVNGQLYTATNNGNGTWTLADNAITPALALGTYDVTAVATDTAGNNGTDATTGELIVNIPNNPPVLDLDTDDSSAATGANYKTTFTEGGSAIAIGDVDVSITDLDNTNLASATITLTNLLDGAAESLAVSGSLPAGITASAYDSATGVITLSGSASLAAYQTAIAQIVYSNTSDTPSTSDRSITVVVNDGTTNSNIATTTVSVVAVHDVPVLDLDANNSSTATGIDYKTSFTEGGSAVAIADTDISLTSPEAATIASATITLTNPLDGAAEALAVSGSLPAGITASAYDSATGVITLSGSATLADYQTAIAQITYNNSSDNPTATNRSITVVVNDGIADSLPATTTISVIPVNDPPVLDLDANNSSTATGANYKTAFTENGSAIAIGDVDVSVTDLDNTNITSATITLTNPLNGASEGLSVSGSLPAGITASAYNPATGVITLSGSGTLADYQTAIAQITYSNTSDNPTATDRSITVFVNDGAANSNTATTTISVIPVNDPPVLDLDANNSSTATGANYKTTFTENGSAIAIGDVDVSVTDLDNTNIASATITLTNPLNGTAESLAVSGSLPAGITASAYDSATGVITLSGSASLAAYQTAIAQIVYNNTSDTPITTDRSVTVVVNDGTTNSNIATTTVSVVSVNDLPVLDLDADNSSTATGINYKTSFTEGGSAVAIADTDISLTDPDTSTIASATITLANQLDGAAEALLVSGSLPAGITATVYDPATGVITLSGSASLAAYQTAIAQITYSNTSDNPTATNRTITVVVNDGTSDSNAATTTISITPVNDAPVLDLDANDSSTATGANYKTSFTEGGSAIAIGDVDVSVTDLDNTNIASATVTLTNPLDSAAESLAVSGSLPAGITASAYNPATGVITLSGSASLAAYQTAIAQIVYNNTSDNPTATDRSITVFVNDGAAASNTATTTISIAPVNDIPVLDLDANNSSTATGANYKTSFTEGGSAVAIADTDISVTDPDNATITSATITLTNPLDGAVESLAVSGSLPAGITASAYDSATGVITLSGSATLADYQTAIAQIIYSNASDNPTATDRSITVVVNDGTANSSPATTTISVVPVNDPPVVDLDANNSSTATGANYKTSFTENGSAVAIGDVDVSITDVDNANITSATITLTNILDGAAESLAVSGSLPAGITASTYNAITGVITLSGSASLSAYQTAIAQITYSNTSDNPTATNRSITVFVNDGVANSNTATTTVSVVPVNDPPVLDLDANNSSTATGANYKTSFTEGGSAVAIGDVDVSVTDLDNTNIASATITLTNILDGAAESLAVSGSLPAGITATAYNPATGVITLSGSASLAVYQTAIAQITYNNSSDNPTATDRSITVFVNDGAAASNTATTTISIAPVNDIPVLDLDANNSSTATGANYKTSFTEGGSAVAIADVDISVTDLDNTNITSATITLTNRLDGTAEGLSVAGSLPAGITATTYDPATGIITLSGSASLAAYQTAIAQITYSNTSDNPTATDRSITVVVNDGTANSSPATATVSVVPVNDPPVLDLDANDSSTATGANYKTSFTEGGSAVAIADVDVSVTDLDNTNITSATITLTNRLDGAAESLAVSGSLPGGITASAYNAATGVITLAGSASLATYQTAIAQIAYSNASSNPTNTDRSITVVVNDGAADSNIATTTISLVPVNNSPVLDLDGNDSSTATGSNYLTTFTEGGSAIAIADVDASVTDLDNANIASVTITLTNPLDGAAESLAVSGSLPAGITASAYNPATGVITLSGSASLAAYQTAIAQITYNNTSTTPTTTNRSVTVVVNDGIANSNPATTMILIDAKPNAVNDSFTVKEDQPLTGSVADADVGNAPGLYNLVTGVNHGTLIFNPDGSFSYTPAANYAGTDSFTYQVTDADGDAGTATVTITIDPVPDPTNDTFTVKEDQPLTGSVADVDAGNAPASYTVTSGVSHGTLNLNSDGSFSYTPAANYTGTDSFTYQVTDANGDTGTATATITIDPVPDPVNDTFTIKEDQPLTGSIADTDIGNAPASYTVTGGVSHGTLNFNSDGSFSYTPAANYSGTDSFTYQVTDANGDTGTATATITIDPVPDAVDDAFTINEDQPLTGTVAEVDTGSGSATYTVSTGVTKGSLTLNTDGTFSYSPNPDFNGSDSFTYTITDANGDTDTATVAITVNPVADVVNDTLTTVEVIPHSINVLTNDHFQPGAQLTGTTQGTHGSVLFNSDGTVTYTPSAGYIGADSFSYTVTTAAGDTETATVNVTVNRDTDGDTIADIDDLDDDNDGIPDAIEENGDLNRDTDSDGVVDRLDLDADNDGILDVMEAGHTALDANQDGRVDGTPASFGSNGLLNSLETAPDSGLINYQPRNTDGDRVFDFQDLDSDNDGINDVIEGGGQDTDGNALIDGFIDINGNGIADKLETTPLPVPDTDSDGAADYRDLDSDNDGLPDLAEGGHDPVLVDKDGDGVVDAADADGDGIQDGVDGNPNVFGDRNGLTNSTVIDSDNDGIPDYRELDSNNNGIPDRVEAGLPTGPGSPDANSDGKVDNPLDADRDGVADSIDVKPGIFGGFDSKDSDGDGVTDIYDLDDDNDGIPDTVEQNGDPKRDSDGDGIIDRLDLDSDNDGILDLKEAGHKGLDANGDGRVDGPSGKNGLADSLETTPESGITNYTPIDTDGDGVFDFQDLDSDNDGISDVIEAGGQDPDGDGIVGQGKPIDTNGDGLADSIDPQKGGIPLPVPDRDGDGQPNYRDLDSDNDGIPDLVEQGLSRFDANNDGKIDGADSDRDGLIDAIDGSDGTFGSGGTPLPVPLDQNANGVPDFLEPPSLRSGTQGADNVTGTNGDDILNGFSDIDILRGLAGNDLINGGSSRDTMYGDEGDDTLNGGSNDDYMDGGTGNDRLNGGTGNDIMLGGAGNDIFDGGEGQDFIRGNQGDDIINGGDGNDRLYGDEGKDIIHGNRGNDLIVGGFGKDLLTGGQGRDRFAYTSVKDFGDIITDFEIVKDRIDVKPIKGLNSIKDLKFIQRGHDTIVKAHVGKGFQVLAVLEDVRATTLTSHHFVF